ncbi:unnamed protein product [Absidia cylindrospora]
MLSHNQVYIKWHVSRLVETSFFGMAKCKSRCEVISVILCAQYWLGTAILTSVGNSVFRFRWQILIHYA